MWRQRQAQPDQFMSDLRRDRLGARVRTGLNGIPRLLRLATLILKQMTEVTHMSIRKSLTNVLSAVIGVMLIAAIAFWQFYRFVTFKNSDGLVDVQGGTIHLWLALGAALLACLAGFLVFSVFLRYDKTDEMHITTS